MAIQRDFSDLRSTNINGWFGEPSQKWSIWEGCGYLKATLEAIAKSHPAARIDELMLWNFKQNA